MKTSSMPTTGPTSKIASAELCRHVPWNAIILTSLGQLRASNITWASALKPSFSVECAIKLLWDLLRCINTQFLNYKPSFKANRKTSIKVKFLSCRRLSSGRMHSVTKLRTNWSALKKQRDREGSKSRSNCNLNRLILWRYFRSSLGRPSWTWKCFWEAMWG